MSATRALFHAVVLLTLSMSAARAEDFEAHFTDPAWDGQKVPDGQQCQRFGGHGSTPEIAVSGIPAGVDLIVLEFGDRTYEAMNNGGHGKVGFAVAAGTTAVTIPSVAGHTVDLPAGFTVVAEHRAPTWDKPGAYLPPCSGGRGNAYHVTVRAVHSMGGELHELAAVDLDMGRF